MSKEQKVEHVSPAQLRRGDVIYITQESDEPGVTEDVALRVQDVRVNEHGAVVDCLDAGENPYMHPVVGGEGVWRAA